MRFLPSLQPPRDKVSPASNDFSSSQLCASHFS
jgi:hypothetical protein